MASITADTFYNLSNQHHYNNNKEFIYVKLTDSALRAIEDYVKNQNKLGPSIKPSIQFHGNDGGFLSFPTLTNGGSQPIDQKFSFSLTEEEKQGPFECLQQTHGQINVLGGIQQRMRVQAQEDVYEKTRASMTQAAQIKKNTCAREIKPNQTDIGRKVTKKPTATSNGSSSNSIFRTTTSGQSSSLTPNSLNSTSSNKRPHESNLIGNLSDNGPPQSTSFQSQNHSHSYNQANSSPDSIYQHDIALNGVVGDDVDHQRTNSGLNNTIRNGGQQNHRIPDIMKKPIKERLIHLLALRPFKKPELYDRLTREGISPRDRSVIHNVLRTISYTRDNAFLLHRHVWNDVHEDWPFYSDQDRSTLKRRKPQNLTPPLSSDGGSSSTSGQSPNSQHNGSPPPAVKRPSSQVPLNPNKALNTNIGNDNVYSEPAPKKKRISRVQDAIRSSNSYESSYSGARDSDDYYNSNSTPNSLEDSGLGMAYSTNKVKVCRFSSPSNISNGGQMKNGNAGGNNGGNIELLPRFQRNGDNRTNGSSQNNLNSSSVHDTSSLIDDGFRESKNSSCKSFSEFPPITSVEQRRRYKTEFDKDYAEYRQLHLIMDKARRRFAGLQQELKSISPSERKYKEIQNQIVQEYKENNNNGSFLDKKQKFDYLHEKLSHIKKLVSDFDSRLTRGSVNDNDSQTTHATY